MTIKEMWNYKMKRWFRVKPLLLVLVVLVVTGFGIYSYVAYRVKIGKVEVVEESFINPEGRLADVDGNGSKEEIYLISADNGERMSAIFVNDFNGNKIASTPDWMGTFPKSNGSFKTYKLLPSENKDFFSLDFNAGPHQSERMFFEVFEGKVLPVCFREEPKGAKDCLFYAANIDGGIALKDLDGDGYVELVEYVDEYPTDGVLSEEEEKAITQSIDEQKISEFTEGARRIALREKGGRGKSVVWAIYSYDGVYFEPQSESNYERYFLLLKEKQPELIRKSELSEGSLEYNEFVRTFWN